MLYDERKKNNHYKKDIKDIFHKKERNPGETKYENKLITSKKINDCNIFA